MEATIGVLSYTPPPNPLGLLEFDVGTCEKEASFEDLSFFVILHC
jgi:hypothetical protein